MLYMPPITMRMEAKQAGFVIDGPLAFCRHGLVCIRHLAQVCRVWLSPALWTIAGDPGFCLAQDRLVSRLVGKPECPVNEPMRDAVRDIVEQWRRARDDGGLYTHEQIFWPADTELEAVVPKGSDGRLISRLDALAAGLDQRRQRQSRAEEGGLVLASEVDVLADCHRDTLALAAALGDERPIILTTRISEGVPPDLADYLAKCQVACEGIDDPMALRLLRDAIAPALVYAGLVELVATGAFRLAALRLFSTAAILPPSRVEDEEDLRWDAAESGAEAELWDQACAAWYPVP
jgi:hypothetical protein